MRLVKALDRYIAHHEVGRVPLDLPNNVGPDWGAVLANLLAGHYAKLPLAVQLPSDSAARLQLARANLCFALARHSDTTFSPDSSHDFMRLWYEDWEPADVHQPLFSMPDISDTDAVPQTMGENLVAFLNPDGYYTLDADRNAVVRPWLNDLLGKPREEDRKWRAKLYQDISLSTFELLDNIQDHSDLPEITGLCSLSLFTTRSGGSGSTGSLYLTVWDNGCGIPSAIENRYVEALGRDHIPSVVDMVAGALNGEMPHREANRGQGLHRVLEMVNRVHGQLFLATGSPGWRDPTCVMVDHDAKKASRAQASSIAIPVQGTVIVLTLPLRYSEEADVDSFRAS